MHILRIERNFGGNRLNPAVFCDFDDTTAVENVANLILERFGGDNWRKIRERHMDTGGSLRKYQEEAFFNLNVSKDKLESVVRENATLRPYFKDLVGLCKSNNIPLAIVTLGLDFYVSALLQREGLDAVPCYAVSTRFLPRGIDFIYSQTREKCDQWGNCKCAIIDRYRSEHDYIIYVGDGRSDFCPAENADLVFARSYLADHCIQNDINYKEFDDFKIVVDEMRRLLTLTGSDRKRR